MRNWVMGLVIAGLLGAGLAALSFGQTTRPVAPAAASTRPSQVQESQSAFEGRQRSGRRQRRQSNYVAETGSATSEMPQIYELVATRDIFVKGQQFIPVNSQQQNVSPPPSNYGGNLQAPPTELILTGVVKTDVGEVAFLENDNEQQVFRVQVGDPVSGGKIKSISIDTIEFEDSHGRLTHVEVGNNLAGGDVWGVSGGSASTQPSNANPATLSILEKMRQRRLQELGGK
jgi:hypothetical protein